MSIAQVPELVLLSSCFEMFCSILLSEVVPFTRETRLLAHEGWRRIAGEGVPDILLASSTTTGSIVAFQENHGSLENLCSGTGHGTKESPLRVSAGSVPKSLEQRVISSVVKCNVSLFYYTLRTYLVTGVVIWSRVPVRTMKISVRFPTRFDVSAKS